MKNIDGTRVGVCARENEGLSLSGLLRISDGHFLVLCQRTGSRS